MGGLLRLECRQAAATMANLDPGLGKMATEDGAFLRPAMEGSRHLPLDQAVRSVARHGPVALGRGPMFLVVGHKYNEPSVWHDDVDRSRYGRPIRPLPSRRRSKRNSGCP
ncbi:unnamed protein product [Prunus brigantina]